MAQLPPPPYPSVITTGLIAVSAIFPVVSAVSIFLRVAARRKSGQPLYTDDYWIIASWFLTFALSILVWVYAGKSGINYYDVDFLTGTEASLQLVFISSCYVQFPLAAVKIAVLLFYKRIFTTPIFRTCVWIVIGIVALWGLAFFFFVLLELDPVAFPLSTARLRFNTTALGLAQVASSFVLDIIVLCLPLPVIWGLNMQTKRKVTVVLIFWLGAFCAVAAIVRTVLLNQSIREVLFSVNHIASQSHQYVFMVLEPNCSILAACLPTYGPLVTGWRAPESLIRSVRSIFSLRSAGSGFSRPSLRKYLGSASNPPRSGSIAESEIELQGVKDWPGKGRQEVFISGRIGDDVPVANQQGISVTNGVTVQRD
ncbi:hypothetical protein DL764_001283 [Monosporascus ibericus]|uniref:Rhodopsin domain-containing protein n=1 Tax=Monosporascus ibericus TaxID=155417 RepID=A0A4Q4TRU8_9PEZI|nr:hypothetical protein DL764_001283 [Monosporascus ibericus]